MFDTMLAHYVINPGGKHGMDALAKEYLNYEPVSITTLIGKKGKKQKSMRDVEAEPLVDYACEDADVTLKLRDKLAPEVKGNKVFEEIEQPLMPILADLEYEGVNLDQKALEDLFGGSGTTPGGVEEKDLRTGGAGIQHQFSQTIGGNHV